MSDLSTEPPSKTLSPEMDIVIPFDATALLVTASAPTVPVSYCWNLATGATVTLQDVPTLAGGATPNVINQRVRALPAGTYVLRVTFLTAGNRLAMDLVLICKAGAA